MDMLFKLVVVVQVLSALAIIGLVLLQHGKGADMGAAFGSGASGSLFGATGSSNFMSKSTGVAAAIFFSATLALSYMSTNRSTVVGGGVMEKVTKPVPVSGSAAIPTAAPAAPAASPAPAAATPAASAASAPVSSAPAAQIPK
ncbi:preprotein translocase subunit SecG [Janthinobacterium sp.]|uniref:preprotein translocase subunit SecG n=1 Tax=Janthinobacterium sp. TaxID=1871054 RepID=UPI00293D9C94|nr:preprotein translocase subunit SecG [Janthinobacterium sp.]